VGVLPGPAGSVAISNFLRTARGAYSLYLKHFGLW
jgi:hypothetical protein